MIIRLDSARHERLTWEETLEFAAGELGVPQVSALSPVEVRGEVMFAAPDFILETSLRFDLAIVCDRCAKPALRSVESNSRLVVSTRARQAEKAAEIALSEDELGWVEVAGDELDSAPLIREQIQLEIPMRPLCREDCAGLCPRCGADLNDGPCSCSSPEPDPRWGAVLGELKKRMSEGP